jgi:hypothetical protein
MWTVHVCIRCRGNIFNEPLSNNDRGIHIYRRTDCWEGFIKYTVDVGSGAMINIPSLIKIVSAIQKLIWGGIHRHYGNAYFYFIFFQNRESRLKVKDVSLRETAPGKLLILLLHAWVRVKANLLPHYLLRQNRAGTVETMESWQQLDSNNNETATNIGYVNLVRFVVTMATRHVYLRLWHGV